VGKNRQEFEVTKHPQVAFRGFAKTKTGIENYVVEACLTG
jgi:hypothetical protein